MRRTDNNPHQSSATFPLPAAVAQAAVLTGGASRRMGEEKASIPIDGAPVIVRELSVLRAMFERVFLIGPKPIAIRDMPIEVIPDAMPGAGPVPAIATALRGATASWLFVIACDMPLLDAALIETLWRARSGGCDAVVPRQDKRLHPLAAFYATQSLAAWEESIHARTCRVRDVLKKLNLCVVDFPENAKALTNINTPEDLAEAIGISDSPKS